MSDSPSCGIIDCSQLQQDRVIEADVAIVGTGAGGGVAARTLARAGLRVVMIEEGPYKTTGDFTMQEAEAYPALYYEVANRKTVDKAITILQGRAVGGGTTVNWTSCFRIPEQTLRHWQHHHGWTHTGESLAPWYRQAEALFNIKPWPVHNASNGALVRGTDKLGWHNEVIARNVRRCRNLGYCGMGCPVGAKQSTLLTCIPNALDRGATLLTRLRAQRLGLVGDRVDEIECHALNAPGSDTTGIKVRVRARHVVLAAGGIGSPALMLRSNLPDPHGLVGKRTFLHITIGTFAQMRDRVDAYYGAPQTATSNQFLWRDGATGEMGYKIEAVPLQPGLAATAFSAFGVRHAELIASLPHLQPLIAIMRDGFHPDSPGGSVSLNSDGSPVLSYPTNNYLWRGVRHAYASLMQIQFAAGAQRVGAAHSDSAWYDNWQQAQNAVAQLPMQPHHARLFSAHVMGGCAMGADPGRSVVDLDGNHRQMSNLTVIDGSVFPTSIGANPSLPIYTLAAWQAEKLAIGLRRA
jgi:choline dehydrogenase-like flavoprotein